MRNITSKLISVIITTRNRKQVVLDCLASVFKMNYPKFEVIVVDNGSTDRTVEKIKNRFPQVRVIEAKKNLGLNGGKNLGQKCAKGEYFLFLDSDTIVDQNFLTTLAGVAESNPKVGLVCPKMYFFDEKEVIWYAGAKVNLWTSQTKNLGCNEKDIGQYDQVRETHFAPTAYLATRQVAEKLKGHEKIFFMTYGDTDFGFRVRKAGYKVLFCPQAKLWHRLGKEENTKTVRALGYNLPMRAYYFSRNRVIFMKKHAPAFKFWIFLFIFSPLFIFYITYKIITYGGWPFLKPHLEGSLDGLKYAFGGKVKNRWT